MFLQRLGRCIQNSQIYNPEVISKTLAKPMLERFMEKSKQTKRTRREFLRAFLAMPLTMVISAWSRPTEAFTLAPSPTMLPTPDCGDDDDVTPRQTEGPYYTPNSPERTSLLEPGVTGTQIIVTGQVLSIDCKPVAHALVDFWHADNNGVYDNVGYKLRGHQFTDEAGRYTLKTIVPGMYPGRTRHFHVKVQAPNQRILTTQLYFPGEPRNKTDRIFNPVLLMDVKDAQLGQEKTATFNFILKIER
jgi:protocatechuate 3,4-dioxygenase beta subunit